MKLFKTSLIFLLLVLILWGLLVLFTPKDDKVFHVIIDPGHGGKDPGAVVGDVYEKNINLAISLLVRDNLSEYENIKISMTREDDSYISLGERVELANKIQADIFVSIHANALEDLSYSGLFTFYPPNKPSSKKIAELIQSAVSSSTGAINRGVRSDSFYVLSKTDMPAVLIETGFMTCPEELILLTDREYQIKLANGISDGILSAVSGQ